MQTWLTGLAILVALSAQPDPSFEVASVKPQPWTGSGSVGVTTQGNTLRGEHTDLYGLVEFAYGLKDFQLSGGPAWAKHGRLDQSELFQVVARAGGDTVPSMDQFQTMLQGLLAERFQLRVRHATKDLPVYRLVVGKGGLKMRESASDSKSSMSLSGGNVLKMVSIHVPLDKLAGQMELYAGRPVIDVTGLTGFYDFEMEWTPNNLAAADDAGPSISTGLQRLGLKLESGTAPLETVVIESAERPSGN